MNLAPIVLFVYNRPWHTEQTLIALMQNELAQNSILYIYADGPKEDASPDTIAKMQETRTIIRKKNWCKEVYIIEAERNKGLAESIIDGVTHVLNKFKKAIVLEDDLITSTGFLQYMNDALRKYVNAENVMQISGHCFPVSAIKKKNSSFFIPFCTSWGWGTWQRAWNKFDKNASGYERLKTDPKLEMEFNLDNSYFYSKMLINQMESKNIDSWAIRWWWSIFKENGISLFPDKSLVKNIGFDTSGTHTQGNDPFFLNDFDVSYFIHYFPATTAINKEYFEEIKKSISSVNRQILNPKDHSFWKKIVCKLRLLFE